MAPPGRRARSLALVNGRTTPEEEPIANRTSRQRALEGIAGKINREQAILFLYVTSRGSDERSFHLNPLGLEVNDLPAETLAEMFNASG